MANINDDHQKDLVMDFVKDAVVSDPDSPSVLVNELFAAGRARVISKSVDRSEHPTPQRLFHAGDHFGGAPGDLNPVPHAGPSLPSASAISWSNEITSSSPEASRCRDSSARRAQYSSSIFS